MSDAKLFAITGFGGGVSLGIQADTYEEFLALAQQVYGDEDGAQFAAEAFDGLRKLTAPTATAVSNLAAGGVVSGYSNVVKMPQAAPAAPAVPAGPPPTLAYPGDCEHGQRQYKDTIARGKPWRRWECALPWSREIAAQRCKAINV